MTSQLTSVFPYVQPDLGPRVSRIHFGVCCARVGGALTSGCVGHMVLGNVNERVLTAHDLPEEAADESGPAPLAVTPAVLKLHHFHLPPEAAQHQLLE